MATFVKCDFCKDEYETLDDVGSIDVRFPKHKAGKVQDICPLCIQKVDSALGGKLIPAGVKV